ncbi:MAG TPA: lipopolysaccharide biosynthesis protein [Steroidobacteraceae bacterium]|nr:lipopolysaccharide biosynthesis protein [Steroidobacteraceae bacterium]
MTMSGLGNRTAILTLSRLASYGLQLISPIFLVRLLTVADFGRYREFLLYAAILQAFAQFSINDSLLYCVPANPQSPWRLARQTALLTLCSSVLVVLGLVALDSSSGGRLVNGYVVPLAAYTLFSVNLDFWEYFWLANGRAQPVFFYSAGRLAVRVLVVVVTASLTHDFHAVIWALVALEGARFVAAGITMLVVDRSRREPPLREPWRDQLRFCIPSGTASLLAMLNRNISNVIVARSLGAVALAQYAIGRFGEPVVATVRNSVSAVILPEMVRKDREGSQAGTAQDTGSLARDARSQAAQVGKGPLVLWQKATVVNAILLFPIVVLVARYAQPLVVMVFGSAYLGAALIMQIYMLVVIRECFDFAPALRALNRTRPLVESNVAGLLACTVAMLWLIPVAGLAGAMIAFVIASYVDVTWLGWRTLQAYGVRLRELLPWWSIARTALAAAVASVLIANSVWTEVFGRAGIVLAGLAYLAAFALLLQVMRIPEAMVLQAWGKRLVFRRASQAREV